MKICKDCVLESYETDVTGNVYTETTYCVSIAVDVTKLKKLFDVTKSRDLNATLAKRLILYVDFTL